MKSPIRPQQSRSQASLGRILDATERLLEDRPFSEITVSDIAEEASVSTGLLYSRFESKDAILPYVVTRFLEQQEASFREALGQGAVPGGSLDIRERVEALVRQVAGMADRSTGLLRAAAARRLLNPGVLTEEELVLSAEIRSLGRSWLQGGARAVRRDDPERALDFVNWMVFLAGQIGPMVAGDPDELTALMSDLTDAMTLYLTAPSQGAGEEEVI